MAFRLRLLGAPSLSRGGGARISLQASIWPLLGFLLSTAGREATRESLSEALWPDQDGVAARHCLATALWRFKNALGGDWTPLVVTTETVSFKPGARMWVDCLALERRLRPLVDRPNAPLDATACWRLRRAVDTYLGDFLPTVSTEWALLERERLRCVWLDSIYALARAYARASDWGAVVVLGRTLCAAEPLREDAHRLLMIGYSRCGNRALAVRQFQACTAVLRQELGIEPMDETVELYRSIVARSARQVTGHETELRNALLAARTTMQLAISIVDDAITTRDDPVRRQ